MKYTSLGFLWPLALSSIQAASPVPENCDPSAIQSCLDRFELRYAECDEGDTYCQCIAVLEKGASCYAACPQDAMTMFIKTYSDGMCATFDPHMQARSTNESISRFDTEAARIKSWLGINVPEDHDLPSKHSDTHIPKSRSIEQSDINNGYVLMNATNPETPIGDTEEKSRTSKKKADRKIKNISVDTQAKTKPIAINSTASATATSTSITGMNTASITGETSISSRIAIGKHVVDIGYEKALTVTAAEPTTTASLSPQEYQSRLEKERYKANLRSVRSEQRRISSEQEAQRALANSRLAVATSTLDYDKYIEKDVVATSITSASSTPNKAKKQIHSSTAESGTFVLTPAYSLFILVLAVTVL